jgi:glycosyltransferase involved in cell wall biosynthesis
MRTPTPTHESRSGPTRIAVVVNELGAGAATRAAIDQAACLEPATWQVEIASLDLGGRAKGAGRLPRHVPVRRPGLAGLTRWLREFRPLLVHAHLGHATVACRAAAPFAGEPVLVASCHELADWREHRLRPLSLLARAALHHYNVVLAASEAVRAAIAEQDRGLAARVRVLRHGIDLSGFTDLRGMHAAAREVLGYRPGTFVLGVVGRLDERKGVDLLLEAASLALHRVPGLELLIVGDGAERPRLVALASERGLVGRVRFVGERADVRPYLAAFDLFAAPSRGAGAGVTLIEAMAAGVPVAGSPVGGIPEVLDGGAAGWLVPLTPQAWAEAIARAARLPGELQRMAEAGRARAGEFSLEHMREQLAECYRTALGASGEPESLAA